MKDLIKNIYWLKIMRYMLVLGVAMSFQAQLSMAEDAVDSALKSKVSMQVTEQVRSMIQKGVDQAEAIELVQLMHKNKVEERVMLQVQITLEKTVESGLSDVPVMNKLREGLAKGVNDQRLVGALERVRNRYEFAYSTSRTMESDTQKQEKLAKHIADCMSAGMEEGQMLQIRTQLRLRIQEHVDGDLPMETMATTRLMARKGVENQTVKDVINQALEKDYSSLEMKKIRESFSRASGKYAANAMAKGIKQSIDSGQRPGEKSFGSSKSSSGASTGSGTSTSGSSGGSGGKGKK